MWSAIGGFQSNRGVNFIHLARQSRGKINLAKFIIIWGATLTGIAFVLPSFITVLLLRMAYKLYGALPWIILIAAIAGLLLKLVVRND